MKKSRIKHIFSTLSKKEIRDLRKWLHSPAHNQREDTVRLFEYLVANDRLQTEQGLDKTSAFLYVFPEATTYEDTKMRQTMYFLLKVVEDFLVYNQIKSNSILYQLTLAKGYQQLGLEKNFRNALEKGGKENELSPFRNKEYYQLDFEVKAELSNYLQSINKLEFLSLQETSTSLDIAFLSNRLYHSCLMAAHQRVFKNSYDFGLQADAIQYVVDKKLIDIPAIGVYFYGYKTITDKENESHFKNLRKLILKHIDDFPKEEGSVLYLMAINYCVGRMNAGDMSYLRETFELYKNGFAQDLLIVDNEITRWTFINVASIGLRLTEFEWVKAFIVNYQKYINEKYRTSVVCYCLVKLHFETNNYNKAMELYAQIEPDDFLIFLNSRTILLKIYYELDEYNPLDSLLGSMRTYLRRKKVVGYHKTNYQNIIKYVKKLLKVNPYDKVAIEKLKIEVEGISPLTERKWLLEQLNKLKK